MHEMHTDVIDVRGVCLSVCHAGVIRYSLCQITLATSSFSAARRCCESDIECSLQESERKERLVICISDSNIIARCRRLQRESEKFSTLAYLNFTCQLLLQSTTCRIVSNPDYISLNENAG